MRADEAASWFLCWIGAVVCLTGVAAAGAVGDGDVTPVVAVAAVAEGWAVVSDGGLMFADL